MSKYDELKKLAEAATPGPWSYDGSYICPARVEGETTYVETWCAVADSHQTENVRFIAAANPAAILELIAENERLTQARRLLADVQNGLTCDSVHHVKADQHESEEPCPVLARIDAFLESSK